MAAIALTLAALTASCSANGTSAASKHAAPASSNGAAAGSSPSAGTVATQRPASVEKNPPGDIPDNIAYITYRNSAGRYSFVHPEGWASVASGASVTFTDKLNGITATAMAAAAAPTVSSAKQGVAGLRSTEAAFELRGVKAVTLPGGSGVLIIFRRNSAADPVTGKVFRDEVNRYEIYKSGREVILDLYGAVGSDNVDPYTKISQSLRLS